MATVLHSFRTVPHACALACAILLAGCGDNKPATNKDQGTTVPDAKQTGDIQVTTPDAAGGGEASFKDLEPYSVLKGEAKLAVDASAGVTKLELLADGTTVATLTAAPWEFAWDTTKTGDGLVKLSLKVNGGTPAADKETQVILLNTGLEVTWKAGNSGKVIVPSSGYVDQHLKYHWDMPADIQEVIGVLYWDEPGFKLELALGVGTCPHSGTTAVKTESETSPFHAEYAPGTGSIPEGNQWFGHVQLMNATEVLGKETPFLIKAYLIK